jgi:hypothetical protein
MLLAFDNILCYNIVIMSSMMRSRAPWPLSNPEHLVVSCVADLTKNPQIAFDGIEQSSFLYAPDPVDRSCIYFLVASKDHSSHSGPEHILAIHKPVLNDQNIVQVGDIIDSVVVAPNAESSSRAMEFVGKYRIVEFLTRLENSTPTNVLPLEEQVLLALSR